MNNINDFDLLKSIINKEDPIGLIDFDSPESLSEYEPEIIQILKVNVNSLSNDELGQRIYNVFVKMFTQEIAGEKEKYYRIAEKFLGRIE